MGKLLQKLVNGIVPSWLTKIKSSATAPPKKLLPFFKGITHVSSTSPSSSTRNNTEELPLVAYGNTDDQSIEDEEPCSKAWAESSIILVAKQGKAASMKQKAHKNDEKPHHRHHHHRDHNNDPHHPYHVDVKTYINKGMHVHHHHHHHHQDLPHHEKPHHCHHHYQDHDDPRHPHCVDLKTYINQGMHEHGTNSCTPPGIPSSRKQGTPSIHKDKHDHPPQQHHGNCNNALGLQKRNQCMPEADNHHHQEARSGHHNADHVEFCNRDFLELDEEVNVCVQEDNHHNYHEKEQRHELEIGYEHYKNGYNNLLGLKRKILEEGEEEEEGESHGSGNINRTRWGWKRRKGERMMSCELPESICSIVGYGKAVVKHSQEPHMALWESMVEMIVGNGIWDFGNLKFLLFCYLSLNEPHLHPIIRSSFLQVLTDLERTEPHG